jgi:hypothetical protein
MTLREFAAARGVNFNTLAGWRWRLAQEGQESAAEAAPPAPERIALVEVAGVTLGGERFEVTLASGATVRVPGTFDARALRRLLDVLEGR